MADASAEGNGRTPESDIIVGVAMILTSTACASAYYVILTTIWRDKELIRMTSYKLMFWLGIADVVQCLPHAVTGFFTIFQTTWAYWLAKVMGVLATPFYVAYTILTVILAVQRLVQLASPKWEQTLFSPTATRYWMGVAGFWLVSFILALASPWASIVYYPEWYSWDYDENMPGSTFVELVEEVIELGGILLSFILYAGVIFLLIRTAIVITVYCSILNFFWHNSQWALPLNLWAYMGLNFMWILNSGVYPIIYFIVNGAIRSHVISKGRSIAGRSTVTQSMTMQSTASRAFTI